MPATTFALGAVLATGIAVDLFHVLPSYTRIVPSTLSYQIWPLSGVPEGGVLAAKFSSESTVFLAIVRP